MKFTPGWLRGHLDRKLIFAFKGTSGRLLAALAVSALISPLPVGEAIAKSYFCLPEPIKIGTYRPDDASLELDISVHFPDSSPFWFDDQTGDYIPDVNGVPALGIAARLRLPLTMNVRQSRQDPLELSVAATFSAGQCVPAQMGVVPTDHRASP